MSCLSLSARVCGVLQTAFCVVRLRVMLVWFSPRVAAGLTYLRPSPLFLLWFCEMFLRRIFGSDPREFGVYTRATAYGFMNFQGALADERKGNWFLDLRLCFCLVFADFMIPFSFSRLWIGNKPLSSRALGALHGWSGWLGCDRY